MIKILMGDLKGVIAKGKKKWCLRHLNIYIHVRVYCE